MIDPITGKDFSYLKNDYNRTTQTNEGDPPLPEGIGNVVRGGATYTGGPATAFTYFEDEIGSSIFDDGFAGTSIEELYQHRITNQPEYLKAGGAVVGGVVSALGTFLENVGYIHDYETYKGMFTDIDHDSNVNFLNYLPKLVEGLGISMKELSNEYMPIYEKQANPNSLTDQIFKWNTLKGIVDSVVGFVGTGMVAGAALKGTTNLLIKGLAEAGRLGKATTIAANTARNINNSNKLLSGFDKLSKISIYAKLLQKTNPKLIQTLGAMGSGLITKGAEARMEGVQSYTEVLDKLQPLVAEGIISKKVAENQANVAANEAFEMTMMTAAGDMFMLKGLFKTKGLYKATMLKQPSKLKNLGLSLLGAPKEGFEEMWQEAAAKEGQYMAFTNIKNMLKKDKDLALFKKLGLDQSTNPEGFRARFNSFLSSNESLTAGIIGAISGPGQQQFINIFTGNNEYKVQDREYKEQQASFKSNRSLFNATNKFKEQTKQQVLTEDMRKIATHLGDGEMFKLAQEAAFTRVAGDNLINGTTDQLKEILKENKTEETTVYESMLNEMEDDFIKHKEIRRNINPLQVFTSIQTIKRAKKLIEVYNDKSIDNTLSENSRAEYAKAAKEQIIEVAKLGTNLKYATSTKSQINLLYKQDVGNALQEIANSNSVTAISRLALKFPELKKIATERKQFLISEGRTTSTVKKNIKVESEKVVDKTDEELQIEQDEKDLKNKVATLDDGTKINQNTKVIILDKPDALGQLNTILNEIFEYKNSTTDIEIVPTENDLNELYDFYESASIKAKSQEDLNNKIKTKILEDLYIKAANKIEEEYENEPIPVEDISDEGDITPEIKLKAQQLIDTFGKDNIIDTEIDNMPDITETAAEEKKIQEQLQKSAQSKEELKVFGELIDEMIKAKLDPFQSFKVFLELFTKALNGDVSIIKHNFNKLAGLYAQLNNERIVESYDEIMGLDKIDPIVDPDMPTAESNKKTQEVKSQTIIPGSNTDEVVDLYLNENVENIDKRNETPATSFAHLSKTHVWKKQGVTDEGKVIVGREDNTTTVNGNPLLNPEKYNTGDEIEIKVDWEYDGPTRLSTGIDVKWKKLLKASKNEETWVKFLLNYGYDKELALSETIEDYYPLTISGKEMVAYVHTTAWINNLNVVDDIINTSRKLLRAFRKDIIKKSLQDSNFIFNTTVGEKKIDINKEGKYTGFVLNQHKDWTPTNESLQGELHLGIRDVGTIKIPGNNQISNNVLNKRFLTDYGGGNIYVVVPLGKKNDEMVYHADPLTNNKVSSSQAKALRQAIEIFITGNTETNQLLYDAYKNEEEQLDLKKAKDLNKLLKKILYLYNESSNKPSLESFIKERVSRGITKLGFLSFEKNILNFGNVTFESLSKGEKVDKNLIEKLDRLEENFKRMYFNPNKKLLNSDKFTFVEVNPEDFSTFVHEGNYNSFVKQNTTTTMNSTKLDDGSYAYTYQNIVTFDVNKQISESVEEIKDTVEQDTWINDKIIIKLAKEANQDVKTFLKPVLENKETFEGFKKSRKIASKAAKFSNSNKCK